MDDTSWVFSEVLWILQDTPYHEGLDDIAEAGRTNAQRSVYAIASLIQILVSKGILTKADVERIVKDGRPY